TPSNCIEYNYLMLLTVDDQYEIAIWELHVLLHHRRNRLRDKILPDAVADAPATRMQHDPQGLGFVETEFDEVIAPTERAHLPDPLFLVIALHFRDPGVLAHDGGETPREGCARLAPRGGLAVLVEPDGHGTLDGGAHASEAVGKLLRAER